MIKSGTRVTRCGVVVVRGMSTGPARLVLEMHRDTQQNRKGPRGNGELVLPMSRPGSESSVEGLEVGG